MKQRLSCNPPEIQEHHIRLPEQAVQLLNATSTHKKGITGKRVKIAVIDSGFFLHPFYTTRGYRIHHIRTTRERRPEVDDYGHGTAHLSSLFALAPKAEVLAIKCVDRDPSDALKKAISLKPHIINCAWGFDIDWPETKNKMGELPKIYKKIASLIDEAISMGITVVAAAGNGQHSFPGCLPEVISVGGVFYAPDGTFTPSDASSRYVSSFYKHRVVPDICGLAGKRPHGLLVLVPIPPKAQLAKRTSFTPTPHGHFSEAGQKITGWAIFSGTSAATSMISGAVALILQAHPELTPVKIKELLSLTARIVVDPGQSDVIERLVDVEAALAHLAL